MKVAHSSFSKASPANICIIITTKENQENAKEKSTYRIATRNEVDERDSGS